MSSKANKKPVVALGLLLVATVFVVYAAFRTNESASFFSSEQTLHAIGFGNTVDDEALEAISVARTGTFFFTEPARITSDYALAKIMLAERSSDEARQQKLLGEAVTALEESLRLNPANPYAWFRLAHARNLLGGTGDEITGPLRLSFMTGPYEPRLVFTRLPLALAHFGQLDETTETLLQSQIRFAWKKSGRQTAFLAVAFGMQDYFLQTITSNDPNGTERFQAYVSFIEELRSEGG